MTATHRPDGLARVVITGAGMVSAIGAERQTIVDALRDGRSGVHAAADYAAHGLRSTVTGRPHAGLLDDTVLPRKARRFMGDTALYASHAARAAVAHAGLTPDQLANERCGAVIGSGTGAMRDFELALETERSAGASRVPPYVVPRAMSSTAQAALCALFGLRGISYAISSACSTAIHCLGHAADLLRLGRQDVMLAGGAEEAPWGAALCFDAMGVLARAGNAAPQTASRPYDADRDGFVLGGGAGVLVLETMAHALARGATPLAEIVGFGASTCAAGSLGVDATAMHSALRQACAPLTAPPDYLCTHANGTIDGDVAELHALAHVVGSPRELAPISSIKALTGHTVGAAGAMQVACTVWAMQDGFVPGSANISRLDPAAEGFPILRESRNARIDRALVNTFGFGGTYGALTLARV